MMATARAQPAEGAESSRTSCLHGKYQSCTAANDIVIRSLRRRGRASDGGTARPSPAVKKHRHLSSSRSIPLIGAVGLARPFPVGVLSQLASLFQGFAALGTNGHLACSFESGLSRLSVFIGRTRLLCRHLYLIRRSQTVARPQCPFELNRGVETSGNKNPWDNAGTSDDGP